MSWKATGIGLPLITAAIVGASLCLGASSVSEGTGRSAVPLGQAIPSQVLGETLTAAAICPTGGFCISGDVTNLSPSTPQTLTLNLSNPNSFPIYVTSLTVTAGTTTASGGTCPAGTITSSGWTASGGAVVQSSGVLPPDAIPVPAATSSSAYGTASRIVTVTFDAKSTATDQTPCLSTKIPLTYGGSAYWFGNCISNSENGGLTVPAGQVDCVSSTGKVTGGITIPSGSGLVLMGGASVTGGIKANSGATEFLLCGASVTGGVTVSGASGPVIAGNGNYCASNSISGGLFLTNNTGGIEVVGNKISGGLIVTGNSGSVPGSQSGGEPASVGPNQFVGGNKISGGITCTPNNSPGLSSGGSANSISGPRTGSQCQGSF
ncbi:MAG TPA: hypothetical protein VFP54_01465 [Acidimicrobiales bacterium]|nr:hypothetical protein [Acidimicrobiales bacterium]